jgi:hypothetical protein
MWEAAFESVRAARFDSMVRNFFEMFLRARRALEFSHSQDPKRTSALSKSCNAFSGHRLPSLVSHAA